MLRDELLDPNATGWELDFDGVEIVSDSFADKLFGVLIVDRGEDRFREKVALSNLNSFVRISILSAVSHHLSQDGAVC